MILHRKTRSSQQEDFCQLTNQYPKGTNYKTSRLALLIETDGQLLWNELLLSKAIIFCSKILLVSSLELLHNFSSQIRRKRLIILTSTIIQVDGSNEFLNKRE